MFPNNKKKSKKKIGIIILSLFLVLIVGFISSTYIISENNYEFNKKTQSELSSSEKNSYMSTGGLDTSGRQFLTNNDIASHFKMGYFDVHDPVLATSWISAYNAEKYLRIQNPSALPEQEVDIAKMIKYIERYGNLSYGSRAINPYAIKWYFDRLELSDNEKRMEVNLTFNDSNFQENIQNSDINIYMAVIDGKTNFMNLKVQEASQNRVDRISYDRLEGLSTLGGSPYSNFVEAVEDLDASFTALISISIVSN